MGQIMAARQPRIALVHDFLYVYGGAERVLSTLHAMYPTAPIYTTFAEPAIVARHFPQADIRTSSLQKSLLRRISQRLVLGLLPRAVEEFDLAGYDLVISSSGAFSHGVITGPETFHLCYCHSPMRYAWDQHAEYLRQNGFNGPLRQWAALSLVSPVRLWDAVSAQRVDQWVANSKTVQARIAKFYGKKSLVVPPPVDTEYFDYAKISGAPTGKAYAVTASRLSTYKRIDLMIAACARLDLPLRIIGEGEDRDRLEKLNLGRAMFRGSLSEEKKRSELAGASCFLFAAEDDFGIAPVEALALGVPVIAFGQGGATEYVQSGKNGRIFHEQTSESLAAELEILINEGVSMNREQIRATALPYGRDAFAKNIFQIVGDHVPRD